MFCWNTVMCAGALCPGMKSNSRSDFLGLYSHPTIENSTRTEWRAEIQNKMHTKFQLTGQGNLSFQITRALETR